MTDIFQIERNIPMPEPSKGVRNKYPWAKLQIDESFLVPCGEYEVPELMNSLTSCRAAAQRKTGFRFSLRKIKGQGVRVWRTK